MSNKNIEMVVLNSDKYDCVPICYKTFLEILKKYFISG